MAHTTFKTINGAECKIYFGLRNTGSNTLGTNYFGGYQFYPVEATTKRQITDLIYKSNHVNGQDVYSAESLRAYRYNGSMKTQEQEMANIRLKAILVDLSRTTTCYTEERAVATFGTHDSNATATEERTTTAAATASRPETYTMNEPQRETRATEQAWASVEEILRGIQNRGSYHSNHNGSGRSIVQTGLAKIQAVNGVKTSIAIELEMGTMNATAQRKFAQLLHDKNVVVQFECDSTVNGGEYPTEPMDINKFIDFIEAWQNFIRETNNDMAGAGAHITIGKSNATAQIQDLRIRLSRYCLLLSSITTQNERRQLFGRDFASYARKITDVCSNQVAHGYAFSCDDRVKAFEFRLSHWQMDVRATVRILNEIASVVFYHKPTPADFARFVTIVGEETARLRNEQGDLV